MWRGGCRSTISVAAPFVWRCLTGSAVAPFPHPAHPDPVREARKSLLLRMLLDPRWPWRSLGILSHTIGADQETTKALLLEVGAQGSEDGNDLWALIARLDRDARDRFPIPSSGAVQIIPRSVTSFDIVCREVNSADKNRLM